MTLAQRNIKREVAIAVSKRSDLCESSFENAQQYYLYTIFLPRFQSIDMTFHHSLSYTIFRHLQRVARLVPLTCACKNVLRNERFIRSNIVVTLCQVDASNKELVLAKTFMEIYLRGLLIYRWKDERKVTFASDGVWEDEFVKFYVRTHKAQRVAIGNDCTVTNNLVI